ncbi:MAG: hypothetical protein EB121_04340 [Alphaproteobacteria bacterium]|nr:hypothetical protein [Alphaproteobacteria bacterium]
MSSFRYIIMVAWLIMIVQVSFLLVFLVIFPVLTTPWVRFVRMAALSRLVIKLTISRKDFSHFHRKF